MELSRCWFAERAHRFECASEVFDSERGRVHALRSVTHARRVVADARPIARRVGVIRQVRQVAGGGRRAEEVLHGLYHVAVEGLTFASEELAVDGLARQRMPERQAVRPTPRRAGARRTSSSTLRSRSASSSWVRDCSRAKSNSRPATAPRRATRCAVGLTRASRRTTASCTLRGMRSASIVRWSSTTCDQRGVRLGQHGQNLFREEGIALRQPEDGIDELRLAMTSAARGSRQP